MAKYEIPHLPLDFSFESVTILKQLNQANRRLAELKGVAQTIPNENILISTLTLQEAKDSSEVENIVTTQDDLYQGAALMSDHAMNAATKEVLNYREALQHGFSLIKSKGIFTVNSIKEIQSYLEHYRLIQAIRDKNVDNEAEWEAWVLFILKGIEETAEETTRLVKGMSKLMGMFKSVLRPKFGRLYRHELLNNLFFHPYTKVEFLEKELNVSRATATRYLNGLVETKLVEKIKIGRTHYYMNLPLIELFMSVSDNESTETALPIESVSDAK